MSHIEETPAAATPPEAPTALSRSKGLLKRFVAAGRDLLDAIVHNEYGQDATADAGFAAKRNQGLVIQSIEIVVPMGGFGWITDTEATRPAPLFLSDEQVLKDFKDNLFHLGFHKAADAQARYDAAETAAALVEKKFPEFLKADYGDDNRPEGDDRYTPPRKMLLSVYSKGGIDGAVSYVYLMLRRDDEDVLRDVRALAFDAPKGTSLEEAFLTQPTRVLVNGGFMPRASFAEANAFLDPEPSRGLLLGNGSTKDTAPNP